MNLGIVIDVKVHKVYHGHLQYFFDVENISMF